MFIFKNVRNIAIGLLFIILQIVIFRHLKFYQMMPDIVIIYLLWIIATTNRTTALVITAVTGFFQDALMDLWGVNMFAKTLTVFIAYNFIPRLDHTRPLLIQVFVTTFLFSLLHFIIFLGVSGLINVYNADIFFWRHWLGNSLYTALMGIFIYLFYTEKR